MESPPRTLAAVDTDMHRSRQAASMLIHIVDRYIPDACRRDAYLALAESLYKSDMELVSKMERKEYEAFRKAMLDQAMKLPPHIIKDLD